MLLRARAAVARRRQWLFVSASTKKHVSLLLLPSLLLPHLLLLLGRRSLQMGSMRSRLEIFTSARTFHSSARRSSGPAHRLNHHRQIITT